MICGSVVCLGMRVWVGMFLGVNGGLVVLVLAFSFFGVGGFYLGGRVCGGGGLGCIVWFCGGFVYFCGVVF